MLLRALFLIALIAILSETVLHAAASLAEATLHHRAIAAVQAQMQTATALEQATIANAVASGGDPHVVPPSPATSCVLQAQAGCAISAHSLFALVTPGPSQSPACEDTDCTSYVQENDAVTERRVSVRISTSASGPSGAQLASRDTTLMFRVFDTPPYATLSGSLDATLDDLATAGIGDNGGLAAGTGTLVNVEYVDASNPSATPIPGNVWRPQMASSAAASSPWDY